MFTMILAILSFIFIFKLFKEFNKVKHVMDNIPLKDREKIKEILENKINSMNSNTPNIKEAEVIKDPIDNEVTLLREQMPNFNKASFLSKAEVIFDKVFNAFANSNYNVLKSILCEDLYEIFSQKISNREENNLRQEILIDHKKTCLNKIQMLANKVRLMVFFEVSQMSAMINSDGFSLDNPKKLYRNVLHKWIFESNFDEENWILTNTSSVEI